MQYNIAERVYKMKLKQWLREYRQMTYSEYKSLDDIERWIMLGEFNHFNRNKQMHDSQNWRPMTAAEKKQTEKILEQERKRYEISLKIGGIDERGNYTALHHRWE